MATEPASKKAKTEPTEPASQEKKVPQNVNEIDVKLIGFVIQGTILQRMAQNPDLRAAYRLDESDRSISQAHIVLYDHLAAIFRAPQSTPEGER